MSGFAIPQSTSFVAVFKAFLASDHVTEATGKTIAITISKAGGAFGNPSAGATNATEITSGWYKVTLSTTDTGTLGILAVRGAEGTIDDIGLIYYTVKATNGGYTALPDTAVTTNASLVTSGTGTDQIVVASGKVDAGKINGVATTSVTTVNANIGSTQPLNFTGTGASALVKGDTVDIAGSAVSTASAQVGVNVVNAGGTAWASGSLTSGVFASGAITATAIAADAIGASELAADAVTEIAAGVWQDAVAGDFTVASSIGKALYVSNVVPGASGGHFIAGSNAATSITTALTANITGNITGNLSGSVGSVTGAVGSVTGAVGSVTGNVSGNVTGSVGSLATQAKADVNAEVVDTLATDTYAEPGQGSPAATASLKDKIGYLYKAWRNKKTQTATTHNLFNDDAATVDHKSTVSDDGTTATRGEIATGP